MAKSKNALNEYQAACLIGISPELLKWLVRYPAKKQESERKLKSSHKDEDLVFFDKNELLEFTLWLGQPWWSKPGERPPIPEGIKEEVKREGSYECAICSKSRKCDVAHIDPVSTSKNNHPHNLIFLCKDHHTKLDDGDFYEVPEESRAFIVSHKKSLQEFAKLQWRKKDKIVESLYSALHLAEKIEQDVKNSKDPQQKESIQKIGTKLWEMVPDLCKQVDQTSELKELQEISQEIQQIATQHLIAPATKTKKKKAPTQPASISGISKRFAIAAGFVACPLCKGSGSYDGNDCPPCDGLGEVEKEFADRIDVDDFDKVECPLCEGDGSWNGRDCPVCDGLAEMQRRFAERVDLSDFEMVECPLCEGSGRWDSRDCRVCDGNQTMEKQYADRVDLDDYKFVKCPLCKGRGSWEQYDDCPACDGHRTMPRENAEMVELSEFEKVKCPTCKGRGSNEYGNDCNRCGGERKIERRFL